MHIEVTDVTLRCVCGKTLELAEVGEVVLFGCKACLRYVIAEKRDVVKTYFDYRRRLLYWRQMVQNFYRHYTSIP